MFKVFSFGNDAELLSLPCGCGLWMVAIAKSRLNSAEGNGRAETRDTRHQAKVVTAALQITLLLTTTAFATVVSADVDTI